MSVLNKFKDFLSANDQYDDEYYDSYEEDEMEPEVEPEVKSNVQVTRTKNEKVLNLQKINNDYEVTFFMPKNDSEAPVITKALRDSKVCIINIEYLSDTHAQTIADFIAGAAYALNGEVRSISDDIFIAVPSNVSLRGDFGKEATKSSGIGNFFR